MPTLLEQQLQDCERAIERLREALAQPKDEFIRDAAIQRFEFCFDLTWKLLKRYLEGYLKVTCASPRSCFRQAYQEHLISYDDVWLRLTEARNLTSHTYLEAIAERVYGMLPEAETLFRELTRTIRTAISSETS